MSLIHTVGCLLWAAVFVTGRQVDFSKIIDKVNSGDSTWVAGHNFDTDTTHQELERMCGVVHGRNHSRKSGFPVKSYANLDLEIPKEFDARKNWKKCKTIKLVTDQGACGASWAQIVADAFSDRVCVSTKGKKDVSRSTEEMLTCCTDCYPAENPCSGGYVYESVSYLVSNGLSTGGQYKSKQGCQPYTIAPCKHTVPTENMPNCNNVPLPTPPACKNSCTNKKYKKKFNADHVYARSAYYIETAEDAQKDILQYGSAVSVLYLYEDFYTYKSGIYSYKTGEIVGEHAVRIIGWGTENNVDYWIGINNWNTNWGNKGTFKIKRGDDECGVEFNMMGFQVAR